MELNPNTCVVCGEHSDQVSLHYAKLLCNGCRAFFKRSVQGKMKFTECKSGKKCKVSYDSRKSCKSCRWDACVRAGVDITKVQQPKENDQSNVHNSCEDSYHQHHRFFHGGFEIASWESPLVAPTLVLPPAIPTTYAPMHPNLPSRLGALGQPPYDNISLIDGRQLGIAALDTINSIDPYHPRTLPYSLGNPLGPTSSGSTPSWVWLTQPSNSLAGQQMTSLFNSLNNAFTPFRNPTQSDVTRHAPIVYPDQRTSTPNSPMLMSPPGSNHICDTVTPSTSRAYVSSPHNKQQMTFDAPTYNKQQMTHKVYSITPPTDSDIHNVEEEKKDSMNNDRKAVLIDGKKNVSLEDMNEAALDIKSQCQSVNIFSDSTNVVLNTDSLNTHESESVAIQQGITQLTKDTVPETVTNLPVKWNQYVEMSKNARAFMIDELLRDCRTIDCSDINTTSMSTSPGSMLSGLSWMYNHRMTLASLSSATNSLSYETATYSTHNMSELKESPIKYETSAFFNLDAGMMSVTPVQSLSMDRVSSPVDPLTGQSSVDVSVDDTGSPELFVDCENVSDEEQCDNLQTRIISSTDDTSDRLISVKNNDTSDRRISIEDNYTTERLSFETNRSGQNSTSSSLYPNVTTNAYDTTFPTYRSNIIDCQGRETSSLSQLMSYDSGVGASELIVNESSTCDVSQNKENMLTQLTLHKKRPFIDSALGGETESPKRQKFSSQSKIEDVRCGPGFTSTPILKMSREHR